MSDCVPCGSNRAIIITQAPERSATYSLDTSLYYKMRFEEGSNIAILDWTANELKFTGNHVMAARIFNRLIFPGHSLCDAKMFVTFTNDSGYIATLSLQKRDLWEYVIEGKYDNAVTFFCEALNSLLKT